MQQKLTTIYKIVSVIALFLLNCICNGVQAQNITDAEKKAILIYKFAEHIEWENEKGIDRFTIGVLSDNEQLLAELKVLETVQIRDKEISLIYFDNIDDINETNVLVVQGDKNLQIERIIKKTDSNHTLIVTDNCKKHDLIMINFMYSKDNNVDFEIHKANIITRNLIIKPDLLLLGGTEIDVAELYKESQRALQGVKEKVKSLELELVYQQAEIDKRTKEILRKGEEIQDQKERMEQQKVEISQHHDTITEQDIELARNTEELQQQQKLLESRLQSLKIKEDEIVRSNRILDELNVEINKKQNEIANQKTELTSYESQVEGQKTIIYLAGSFSVLVLIIVFFIYRSFMIKKRMAKQLADKRAEISMLFDVAPLPVIMTDLETGKAIYVNQQGQELFKADPEAVLEQVSKDYYVHPEQRVELTSILKKKGKIDDFEVLFKDTVGGQFYGSLSGLITQYEDKQVFFVAIKNITEIKNVLAELNQYKNKLEGLVKERTKELIESQNRFKDLAELLPETIFEMDFSGQILFVNKSGMKSFGYTEEELGKGLNIFDVIGDKDQTIARASFEELCEAESVQTAEYMFKRSDNTLFPGIIYMNCTSDGTGSNIARSIVVDITDRKNIERKILNTIIETEEKERKRVAEDLHDGLGSLLSSLNLYIDMIDNPDLDAVVKDKHFHSIRSIIDESIKSSKEISNNLRPSTLSRFGLQGSLQAFCDKINETKKINIEFNHSGFDLKIDNNAETALYRIVNELINNTIKYASANKIIINLSNEGNRLRLIYKDDGSGFDKKVAFESGGMGLKNIMTRVDSVGGNIEMDSEPGKGVSVIISVEINS